MNKLKALIILLLVSSCYQTKSLPDFKSATEQGSQNVETPEQQDDQVTTPAPGPAPEPIGIYKKISLSQAFSIYFKSFVIPINNSTSAGNFDTRVDYDSLYNQRSSDGYTKLINRIKGGIQNFDLERSSNDEKLAFYINVYNFSAINHVVENYIDSAQQKINSILKIPSQGGGFAIFDKRFIRIGTRLLSLNQVEKEELPKYTQGIEGKIHFAVICASGGCPVTLNDSFKVSELQQQIEFVTREGLKLKRFVNQDGNKLALSSIFKWYTKDFNESPSGSIKNFIERYSNLEIQPIAENFKNYINYDWDLNILTPSQGISVTDLETCNIQSEQSDEIIFDCPISTKRGSNE